MVEALKYNNTRLLVIECSVHIEESISFSLGQIMGFDWKKSKSLGFSSRSLSFFHKIQLMQDYLGKDSFSTKMLQYLSEIRNKFAHVKDVNNFKQLFKIKDFNKIKKFLDEEVENFGLDIDSKVKFEEKYRWLFFCLSLEIQKNILEGTMNFVGPKEYKKGKNNATETMFHKLKSILLVSKEGVSIYNKAIQEVKIELGLK